MPIRIVQANMRVAEVQFVCDNCGKLIRNSLISNEEIEAKKNKEILCCNCKLKKALKK